MPTIEILLSTFNGAHYLPELLDSLLAQTVHDWTLLVRDDGSTDSTLDILRSYQPRFNGRMFLTEEGKNVGVIKSFERLLLRSSADYSMLCDQDDIWQPEKIFLSLEAMRHSEKSDIRPIVVYTNLTVVDASLNTISNSFFRHENIATRFENDLYYISMRNPAAGCTMMLNKSARQISVPFGSHCIMHDWWIALCCTAQGHLVHIDTPTVLYRQHGSNKFGSTKTEIKKNSILVLSILRNMFFPSRFIKFFQAHRPLVRQVRQMCSLYGLKFSLTTYMIKLFAGKMIFPLLGSFSKTFKKMSWQYE